MSAMKVDATALFVKTMYVVFGNNGDVYKNNAVASTLFATLGGFGRKKGEKVGEAGVRKDRNGSGKRKR